MTRRRKILIGIAATLALGAGAGAGVGLFKRTVPVPVFTERVIRRDLEAVVRESGSVRAKTTVPLSASTLGQVKDVLVREGDRVAAGQVVIQIDSKPLETSIAQAEAAVHDAETRLKIARAQPERTRRKLDRETNLRAATSAERLDELTTALDIELREVEAAELRVGSERARLERERHDLTKVRITAPIDGVVLRVNVEKGQNVLMGTMNIAGSELMTIADLSVLQVALDVAEASVLDLRPGQEARVEIDALRDRKLKGRLTEIGTSPRTAAPGAVAQQERGGVLFRAIVTLDETPEGVRSGFSASAEIVTATRTAAIAVPIRALVARELSIDAADRPLPPEPPAAERPAGAVFAADSPAPMPTTATARKKLFEGVMLVKDGKARFQPVTIGITGKEHVEALEGIAEGDEVVTGPHRSLRDLKEGDLIERKPPEGAATP